jgi:actin-related protein 8
LKKTAAMVISTQHLMPPEGALYVIYILVYKGMVAEIPSCRPGMYPPVDIRFEASKLPLDVAIFNSVRAAGVEKIKRFLQSVLIVGGTSLVPGMVHALESR